MQLLPAEDDFADLDAIIAESEARRSAKGGVTQKRERLAHKGLTADERQRLEAEVAAFELLFTWRVEANVALFHVQECTTCSGYHQFFMGWFTHQQHRTDPHCRRLVAGRSEEPVPDRIEKHSQGKVEMCGLCAESCLAIDAALKSAEKLSRDHAEGLALNLQREEQLRREAANGPR